MINQSHGGLEVGDITEVEEDGPSLQVTAIKLQREQVLGDVARSHAATQTEKTLVKHTRWD